MTKFLTFLASEMQRIYGAKHEVHPLHRALLADEIIERVFLNDFCLFAEGEEHLLWVLMDQIDDLMRPESYRDVWFVGPGDLYYAYEEHDGGYYSDVFDGQRGRDLMDGRRGSVWVYKYQNEDAYRLVAFSVNPRNLCLEMRVAGNKDGTESLALYSSLAHYFVLGKRGSCYGDDDNETRDHPVLTAQRILWMHERKLVPFDQHGCVDTAKLGKVAQSPFEECGLAVVGDGYF